MQINLSQSVRNLAKRINQAKGLAWSPPPNLKPSDWAEQNIRIPVGNAIPGLMRFANAPHQREPLDMIANPDCSRVTLMWGAQTGKTQVVNCAIGFNIAQVPSSQIMMQPSQGDLQTWLETKLNPLIDSNPALQGRVAKPRGRDGVNNQRMKSYPGGFLMFAWSGSAKTMRGRSAPKIYCDEVDGYDITNEGHPVSLLWQRAATFGDQRLLMETSTPTVKNASAIEDSFEAGDQRRRYVPCPHCDHYQVLKWSNVHWQRDDAGEHMPETAGYVCEKCAVLITDGEKNAMLRRGEWRAAKPFRGHASYHLSELYSTMRKFRDIVISFLEKKAQNDLQTFINVSLAETWEEQGDGVDDGSLLSRREEYPAPVPADGLVLTCGVDTQDDRLELDITAYNGAGGGGSEESWNIDYRVLWGDPGEPEVWHQLEDALGVEYAHEHGGALGIVATCIDSGGHHTQAVYDFVKKTRRPRVFAIKGVGGAGRPIVSAPSRKKAGKGRRTVDLFTVGVDDAKLLLYSRLQIEEPGPGYCHFPMARDHEYFQGLTAEKRVTKYVKGFPKREWIKTRARNEPLDCRVYGYAALKILDPVWSALAQRNQQENEPEQPEPPPEKETAPPKRVRQRRPRRGGGYVKNY